VFTSSFVVAVEQHLAQETEREKASTDQQGLAALPSDVSKATPLRGRSKGLLDGGGGRAKTEVSLGAGGVDEVHRGFVGLEIHHLGVAEILHLGIGGGAWAGWRGVLKSDETLVRWATHERIKRHCITCP